VTALAARPGLPVLFREPPPSGNRLRATALYRFLVSNTEETRRLDSRTSWRVVRPPGR